jgi:hypothetical protein
VPESDLDRFLAPAAVRPDACDKVSKLVSALFIVGLNLLLARYSRLSAKAWPDFVKRSSQPRGASSGSESARNTRRKPLEGGQEEAQGVQVNPVDPLTLSPCAIPSMNCLRFCGFDSHLRFGCIVVSEKRYRIC